MSKILTLKDSITIVIDNTTGEVTFRTSRDMPGLYVIHILTRITADLAAVGMQQGVNLPLPATKGNDGTPPQTA